MIIFDLDGVLADCEHRRYFIERDISCGHWHQIPNHPVEMCIECKKKHKEWKPDWDAFYEAFDKDMPIQPVIDIWDKEISLGMMGIHQIWTGRSESARKNTEKWLDSHLLCFQKKQLKIRFTGDHTPYEQLKERWLNGALSSGKTIEYVFDSHPESIRMWRRRGIFVFHCNQSKEEF